jgi:alpha-L-arabinofuranosidase
MRKPVLASLLAAILALPIALAAQQPTLVIQANHPTAQVSPTLYGLMTEEINYSYDGGLYAELIRDRAVNRGFNGLAHWTMVARGGSQVAIGLDEQTGPSAALPRSLRVRVTAASASAPAGVQNDGYWGIPVRPHTPYRGSFYAITDTPASPSPARTSPRASRPTRSTSLS